MSLWRRESNKSQRAIACLYICLQDATFLSNMLFAIGRLWIGKGYAVDSMVSIDKGDECINTTLVAS